MMQYTFLSVLSILIAIILDFFVFKTRLLNKIKYLYFVIILIFMHTIVDNYLNGRWGFGSFIVGKYQSYSGMNIFFTPVENYLFGFSLILLNLMIFEKLTSKNDLSA